jgi:hypothetical protein
MGLEDPAKSGTILKATAAENVLGFITRRGCLNLTIRHHVHRDGHQIVPGRGEWY